MTEEVKKASLVNEFGWRIVNGEIEFVKTESGDVAVTFKPPMAVMVKGFNKVESGKTFEVSFNISTQSPAGTLAATFSFVNHKGVPIGKPSYVYLELNTNPDSVSLITGGVPEGTAQVLFTLVVQGLPPEGTCQINALVVKENS